MNPIDWLALAQTASPQPAGDPMQQLLMGVVVPVALVVMFFWIMVAGPQKKQQKEREAELAALKKNDRVLLECGILGVVVGQSSDGRELTVRTHEDTRLTILRSAVRRKLDGGEATETTKK